MIQSAPTAAEAEPDRPAATLTAMENSSPLSSRAARRQRGFTGLQVLGIVVAAMLVAAGLTFWIARTYLWPADFEPVELSQKEQVRLDGKLRAMGIEPSDLPGAPAVGAGPPPTRATEAESPEAWLRSERYAEDPSKREIGLSERELNSLLAHNTDLARRLAIDLSDDLASARLLVPIDPDFPVMGGKTLRVSAGVELAYRADRPVVALRGVSLMGVPIPNAWLGGLKNVDVVEQFGGGPGFWRSFSEGVEFVEIREGELKIKLKP